MHINGLTITDALIVVSISILIGILCLIIVASITYFFFWYLPDRHVPKIYKDTDGT
jgi:hypothetical protein